MKDQGLARSSYTAVPKVVRRAVKKKSASRRHMRAGSVVIRLHDHVWRSTMVQTAQEGDEGELGNKGWNVKVEEWAK